MSQPELLRELQLPQAHLSAASALVRVAERLFVVADDELHLGLFDLGDPAPGRLVRLFEGSLPAEEGPQGGQTRSGGPGAVAGHGRILPRVRCWHWAPVRTQAASAGCCWG